MEKKFNFIDNKDWLLPFLQAFQKQKQKIPDIEQFAIQNVEKIFILNQLFFRPISEDSFNKEKWKECAKSYTESKIVDGCRKSPGFDNKHVPDDIKYNNNHTGNNPLATLSYNYLSYCDNINNLLDTPSSDYTERRREDVVLRKYRLIEYLKKQIDSYKSYTRIDILKSAYEIDIYVIINKFSEVNDDDKYYLLKKYAVNEFDGDNSSKINTDLLHGVDKPTEEVKITKKDSFFTGGLRNGGKGKNKTRTKKRKSKTSKKISKKRTVKRRIK